MTVHTKCHYRSTLVTRGFLGVFTRASSTEGTHTTVPRGKQVVRRQHTVGSWGLVGCSCNLGEVLCIKNSFPALYTGKQFLLKMSSLGLCWISLLTQGMSPGAYQWRRLLTTCFSFISVTMISVLTKPSLREKAFILAYNFRCQSIMVKKLECGA